MIMTRGRWLPVLQADEGKLILAGAAGDPVEGALFVFKNTSKEVGASGASHDCLGSWEGRRDLAALGRSTAIA
jgi:hypothetical protein